MKKKLSIKGLEVTSFVTSFDEKMKATVKGGADTADTDCNCYSVHNCPDYNTYASGCCGNQTLYKSCRAGFCMPD